jgi:hypothetical protein
MAESVSRKRRGLPVLLLAAPAFVAIWSGWVELGRMTGFGPVNPLPGIADDFSIDTAITLPIGVETYAAYAMYVWLAMNVTPRARQFAKVSAIGALVLGAAGQLAYHLLAEAGYDKAPWQITALVACLPVAVLGMGAALAHLVAEVPDVDGPSVLDVLADRDEAAPVVDGNPQVEVETSPFDDLEGLPPVGSRRLEQKTLTPLGVQIARGQGVDRPEWSEAVNDSVNRLLETQEQIKETLSFPVTSLGRQEDYVLAPPPLPAAETVTMDRPRIATGTRAEFLRREALPVKERMTAQEIMKLDQCSQRSAESKMYRWRKATKGKGSRSE